MVATITRNVPIDMANRVARMRPRFKTIASDIICPPPYPLPAGGEREASTLSLLPSPRVRGEGAGRRMRGIPGLKSVGLNAATAYFFETWKT
ncbi:hypothetical protein PPNSA23_18240 [Phyllobacterium phragmitis]|uniref:Uncharacterized protein n=1 Tax=Phyllobacterium phragmitis TaxID=2670329 RepID=A0ABQ0GYY6_9HYPH